MFVAEDMYQLGSQRSAIRELFEYGKQRAAVVGAENVYDFSLGNPTVPAPDCVNETIRDLTQKLDSISLHGYTSAQGDIETRQAIADYLNKTYETAFSADNFYLTMGAAASLSVCFRALTTSPEDEFITIAPFFPEYRVFVEANGAKLVVVPPHTSDFQIDFEALEKAISAHTKGVIINSPNNPSGAVYSKEAIAGAGRALGYVCAPSMFQKVIASCVGNTGDIELYRKNRDLLYDGLTKIGYECFKPQGAFYMFVKALEPDADAFCERAKDQDLLIVSATGFGCPGYARVSYCVDYDMIERSFSAFEKLYQSYRKEI